MNRNYDDIISLPHHISPKRPQMSLSSRAAQFAPVSALVGYDDAVEETARHTDTQIEINEELISELDTKLRTLAQYQKQSPQVCITCFVHDKKKSGGKYITIRSNIKKIDDFEKTIILTDKTIIPFGNIVAIESDMLDN